MRILPISVAGLALIANSACTSLCHKTPTLTIRNHDVSPKEIHFAENQPIVLKINNFDKTTHEIESKKMGLEIKLSGHYGFVTHAEVKRTGLMAGEYPFYVEFKDHHCHQHHKHHDVKHHHKHCMKEHKVHGKIIVK